MLITRQKSYKIDWRCEWRGYSQIRCNIKIIISWCVWWDQFVFIWKHDKKVTSLSLSLLLSPIWIPPKWAPISTCHTQGLEEKKQIETNDTIHLKFRGCFFSISKLCRCRCRPNPFQIESNLFQSEQAETPFATNRKSHFIKKSAVRRLPKKPKGWRASCELIYSKTHFCKDVSN